MECLITKQEAIRFLIDTLRMDEIEEKLQHDKKQLLDAICVSFMRTIPFHNAAFISVPSGSRRTPTVADNIQSVLTGKGGLCWTLNSAMYSILEAIGYNVILVLASAGERDTNDHAVVVVKNLLKENDSYLVDVGFGEPAFQAICLDFDKESETITESFRVYKLIKEGDLYIRINKSNVTAQNTEAIWEEKYSFQLQSYDAKTMYDWMSKTVWNNNDIIFYKSLRFVHFKNKKLLAVKDNLLLEEMPNHRLSSTALESDTAIVDAIREHFPAIQEEIIRSAVSIWSQLNCINQTV